MSSVVNKSKNKFVPKARARARPTGPTPSGPAPPSTTTTVTTAAVSKPTLEDPTPTPTPTSTPEETSSSDDAAPVTTPATAPIPISTPVERQPSPPPPPPPPRANAGIPMVRSASSASSSASAIPMLRSTSANGIPGIQSAMPTPITTPTATTPTVLEEADVLDDEEEVEVEEAPRRGRKPRGRDVDEEEEGEADEDEDAAGEDAPARRPAAKRKARTTAAGEPAAKRKPAQPRKKRTPVEGTEAGPGAGAAGAAAPKKRGRRRAESPEDGEAQEIAVNVVKMKDLCKDMRIGRKSARFMEIQAEEAARAALSQQEREEADEARRAAEEERGLETAEMRIERLAVERNQKGLNAAQVRIVNGEIVIDDESLQIDRRERDALDEDALEIVEENQHTRRITSQTFSKREKVSKWDAEQTGRFYEALSMFGTDFEIISKMFPGRSRRQMRNKYLCEERKNPHRITNALRTRIAINIDQYSTLTSQEFQDPQELEDELQKLRDEHEASETAAASHIVEAERERQEAANAAMIAGDSGIGVGAGEAHKKGRKKKGARGGGGGGGAGEEEVLMSREEYEAMRAREAAEAEE
ncbi:uncharacterized protein H6S33_012479 [Morchella sextelata]|uniref:uncharacterized protein n=1 Tax=Morchella sextelata TaxID=1174677 RepID=UPI001D03EB69|nr:uncharacterized protein H6S33_012479 [Morchella sextelata]KAH0609933.1 hypothetical protein H6S33_012479 [Morchella sextelata]